ncbi:hypothetical protein D047_2861A, partial [Vibrio parahaemolyticus VPTS-2010_2]
MCRQVIDVVLVTNRLYVTNGLLTCNLDVV